LCDVATLVRTNRIKLLSLYDIFCCFIIALSTLC